MLIPQSPTRRPHAAGFRDKLAVLGFSIYWTDLARRARVAVLDILSRIAFDRVQKHIVCRFYQKAKLNLWFKN